MNKEMRKQNMTFKLYPKQQEKKLEILLENFKTKRFYVYDR